jgi:transposase
VRGGCYPRIMSRREALTDEQWAIIAPLIPPSLRRADGRGRSTQHDDRAVLNGVLWLLCTGAAWADLPERFPSGSTCFRYFGAWVKAGVLRKILGALVRHWEIKVRSMGLSA